MPTVLSHPAAPLALGLGLGRRSVPGRLVAAGLVASVVPDLDAVGFHLGVPYGSAFGHRGATHSIAFALALALVGALGHRHLRAKPSTSFAYLFASAVSHGLLDAFTNGGLGVALLWPFTSTRFFAPFRPIEVAPLAASRLFSRRGAIVFGSELVFVWLPAGLAGLALGWLRRPAAKATGSPPGIARRRGLPS
ncbi:MAG TPA: metal-dependent hydrolase [Anaeromyxobacteraceae bacterium]|nr:metal-dependent hydrolase [Anaeromyxobacteraceae bacterium]